MKVRVIAEGNIMISRMKMMIFGGFSYGGFSYSYILRSYIGCMPSSSSPSSSSSSPLWTSLPAYKSNPEVIKKFQSVSLTTDHHHHHYHNDNSHHRHHHHYCDQQTVITHPSCLGGPLPIFLQCHC